MSKSNNMMNFRLADDGLRDRLEEVVAIVAQSRSEVIRYALEAGLDVIDEEIKKGTCLLVEPDGTVHTPKGEK